MAEEADAREAPHDKFGRVMKGNEARLRFEGCRKKRPEERCDPWGRPKGEDDVCGGSGEKGSMTLALGQSRIAVESHSTAGGQQWNSH